jgi:hypothetical protein
VLCKYTRHHLRRKQGCIGLVYLDLNNVIVDGDNIKLDLREIHYEGWGQIEFSQVCVISWRLIERLFDCQRVKWGYPAF